MDVVKGDGSVEIRPAGSGLVLGSNEAIEKGIQSTGRVLIGGPLMFDSGAKGTIRNFSASASGSQP